VYAEFLQKTKDTAPPDFTFILDKVHAISSVFPH